MDLSKNTNGTPEQGHSSTETVALSANKALAAKH